MNRPLYDVRNFKSYRELLDQSVAIYGDSPAFKVKNEVGQIFDVGYRQYKRDVCSLATALLDLGLEGTKIAVAGANSYKWCTSYLAVTCGVGVVVPTDKELPFADIKNILEVSEASAIIFDKKFGTKLFENKDQLPADLLLICMDSDFEGALLYDELLCKGAELLDNGDTRYEEREVDPYKMSILLFTSGTTGMSKAVMLSQANICADIYSIMGVVKINPGERIFSMLPLHHTYECSITFLCCIYGGVTICFCEGLRYITKNLEEYKPHIMIVVPLIIEKFYKRIQKAISKEKGAKFKLAVGSTICRAASAVGLKKANDLFFAQIKKAFGGNIRLIISGAAAIDPVIIRDFNRYGIQTFQGYGLTECSPIVICNNDKQNKYASIGLPIPQVEAKINNPDADGIGEICVKGPMVMLGYYKDEEATASVFDSDGWFHTGDMGYVDSDGFYYLSGRKKSVIVTTNGKNVYPEELEAFLLKNKCIKECIVVPFTDERGNTIVGAKIFPDIQAISADYGNRNVGEKEISATVTAAVRETNAQVVSYKAIKKFEIVDKEFPKTTTSKIKRNLA